jgi:hypothetical protein
MLSSPVSTLATTVLGLATLACLTGTQVVGASPTPFTERRSAAARALGSSPPIFDDGLTYDTLSYNFTLAAVNKTLSNANETGVPLVLGQNGAIPGAALYVTSTYASYPYNDYPLLSLSSSSLRAYTKTGAWITNATSFISDSNTPLRWLTTSLGSTGYGTNYSAILSPGDEFAKLAVLGRKDLWSLCPFGHTERSQVNLVFNVSGDGAASGYAPDECWEVDVNVVMA